MFRKRISAETLIEANEYLLARKDDGHTPLSAGTSGRDTAGEGDRNEGTLILDATCAPANIRYPQDVLLLNEAREKPETIIYRFCKSYGLPLPRRYRRRAGKDYLAFAKSKKHSAKKICGTLREQLGYVARDIRYLERFMEKEANILCSFLSVPIYGQIQILESANIFLISKH